MKTKNNKGYFLVDVLISLLVLSLTLVILGLILKQIDINEKSFILKEEQMEIYEYIYEIGKLNPTNIELLPKDIKISGRNFKGNHKLEIQKRFEDEAVIHYKICIISGYKDRVENIEYEQICIKK